MPQLHDEGELNDLVKTFFEFVNKESAELANSAVASFNRKKAAYCLQNSKRHQTGAIDHTQLPFYRTSENIFASTQIAPKGKSHAIIINVDFSGSIHSLLFGILKQTIIFFDFAKKTGIRFSIRTFTSHRVDIAANGNADIREIANEKTPKEDFINTCLELYLASYQIYKSPWYDDKFSPDAKAFITHINNKWSMGGTPLAAVALGTLQQCRKYRKEGCQIVSAITLTDGDSNGLLYKEHGNGYRNIDGFVCPVSKKIVRANNSFDVGVPKSTFSRNYEILLSNINKLITEESFGNIIIRIIDGVRDVSDIGSFFPYRTESLESYEINEKVKEFVSDMRKSKDGFTDCAVNALSYNKTILVHTSVFGTSVSSSKKKVEKASSYRTANQLAKELGKIKSRSENGKGLLNLVGGILATSYK